MIWSPLTAACFQGQFALVPVTIVMQSGAQGVGQLLHAVQLAKGCTLWMLCAKGEAQKANERLQLHISCWQGAVVGVVGRESVVCAPVGRGVVCCAVVVGLICQKCSCCAVWRVSAIGLGRSRLAGGER